MVELDAAVLRADCRRVSVPVVLLGAVFYTTQADAAQPAGADEQDAAQPVPEPRPDGVEKPAEPRAQPTQVESVHAPAVSQPVAHAAAQAERSRAFIDYSNGTFFLRSADDNLIVATGGRVHVDTYAFAGPGTHDYHRANGTGLAPNMFFRRFVLESGGIVRKHWFFWVGGNFAPTQVDSSQNPMSTAGVYDGFIGYQSSPSHQLYVGQFNAPFTMENVTSSRWLDFMERALSIRTLATPYNKDLGVSYWGAIGKGVAPFEYQVGLFGGDGMNRPNVDNRVDGMARFVVRPLARTTKDAIQRLHVGISGRGGSRDDDYVMYDAPALSTPGGYAFWSPSYKAADGANVHVLPSGNQIAAAAELYVPFERFDIKGELVYVNEGRREAAATDRRATLRRGRFDGFGGYAQISYWPIGTARINDHPAGRYMGLKPPKDRGAESPFGLQLLLRGEMMRLSYDGNARTRQVGDGEISSTTTDIQVNALQAAVNYWATKHIRLTAEYSLYQFPGTPTGANATNQAVAPGVKASPAQAAADHLHEISFRVGLAL